MANLISTLADAITKQEGFFPGSVSAKNNNPGNIMDLDYFKSTGQFRVKAFATLEEGRAALEKLISNYIGQGHTLISFFNKYAPGGHGANDPTIYAKNVAGWTGIPVDVPLNTLPGDIGGPGIKTEDAGDGVSSGEGGFSLLPLLAGMGILGVAFWWLLD